MDTFKGVDIDAVVNLDALLPQEIKDNMAASKVHIVSLRETASKDGLNALEDDRSSKYGSNQEVPPGLTEIDITQTRNGYKINKINTWINPTCTFPVCVLLHELGHTNLKHYKLHLPVAQEEYEAHYYGRQLTKAFNIGEPEGIRSMDDLIGKTKLACNNPAILDKLTEDLDQALERDFPDRFPLVKQEEKGVEV